MKENQEELSRISAVLSQYDEEKKECKSLLVAVERRLEKVQEEERQASERAEATKAKVLPLTLTLFFLQPTIS